MKSKLLLQVVVAVTLGHLVGCAGSADEGASAPASVVDNEFFSALAQFNGTLRLSGMEFDGSAVDPGQISGELTGLRLSINSDGFGLNRSATIAFGDDCVLSMSAQAFVQGIWTQNRCSRQPALNGTNVMQVAQAGNGVSARDSQATVYEDNSGAAEGDRAQLQAVESLMWMRGAQIAGLYSDSRLDEEGERIHSSQTISFITVRGGTVRVGSQYGNTGHYSVLIFD